MLVTEMNSGEGLGNQLARYVAIRVIATDHGYDFGVFNPQKFKGFDFLDIDLGKRVIGGSGPEGGPPYSLPEGITHYYSERAIKHPASGADIRIYDTDLINVPDNTKIDGVMQDEQYIIHRKDEIREWLTVKKEYDCTDYASDNICVLNFRGGEFARHAELFLTPKYWTDAMNKIREINTDFQFVVVTDDVKTAQKFFPDLEVLHFNIGKDYSIIKNAHYLILSNSSFALFPAWLNQNLKYCIAPKYWGRHNISDGYWCLGYNMNIGWNYLDKNGNVFDYDTCVREFRDYMTKNQSLFAVPKRSDIYKFVPNNKYLFFVKRIFFYMGKIVEVTIRYSKKLFSK